MSTALYRRYRPDTFDEVIGQEHVTDPLKAALARNRVNHAYLFSGPRGCGKTTSARILARCLNCAEGPTPTPCGQCDSCRELAPGGGGSLDVIEIDAASHNGVDDARDLRERAVFAPARDRFKVFILDEAHMVTTQGFNALLKLVEEPPPHVKFIFATTEPDKVIGTIRSRTHHYPFRLVPPERLVQYLEQLSERERVPVGKGVLPLVVRAGGGSVRDTLSVLDQLMAGAGEDGIDYERAVALLGYTHAALLDDVVDGLAAGDGAAVYRVVERVIESGHDPRRFVEDLLERFRDLIVIDAAADAAPALLPDLPADQLERMMLQARGLGAAELSRAADVVHAGLGEMSGATSPRLQLDLICARLLLPSAEGSAQALQARLERMERRIGMGATGTAAGGTGAIAEPSVAPARAASHTRGRESSPEPAAALRQDQSPAAQSAPPVQAKTPPPAAGSAGPVTAPQPVTESATESATEPGPASSLSAPAQSAQPQPAEATPSVAAQPESAQPAQAEEPAQSQPAPAGEDPRATAAETASHGQGTPGAPGPGGTEIDAIRRGWPGILNELSGIRKLVWALVNQDATAHSFERGVLTLGFRTPGLAQRFTKSDFGPAVAQAVQQHLGISCTVAAIADDGPAGHPPAGQDPEPDGPGPVPQGPPATQQGAHVRQPEAARSEVHPAGVDSGSQDAVPADASPAGGEAPPPPRNEGIRSAAPAQESSGAVDEPVPSPSSVEDHWRPVEPPSNDPEDPWYTPAEDWGEPGLEPERPDQNQPAAGPAPEPQTSAGDRWVEAPAPIVPAPEDLDEDPEPASASAPESEGYQPTDYLGAYADLEGAFDDHPAQPAQPAGPSGATRGSGPGGPEAHGGYPVTGQPADTESALHAGPESAAAGSRIAEAQRGREEAAARLRQFFTEPSVTGATATNGGGPGNNGAVPANDGARWSESSTVPTSTGPSSNGIGPSGSGTGPPGNGAGPSGNGTASSGNGTGPKAGGAAAHQEPGHGTPRPGPFQQPVPSRDGTSDQPGPFQQPQPARGDGAQAPGGQRHGRGTGGRGARQAADPQHHEDDVVSADDPDEATRYMEAPALIEQRLGGVIIEDIRE
ncbi:DNA polymerase III subunit gamma and tau [Sediminivirga luteola]|uniref:DNA-directed DNA polymerase n=1 Tax=Sediminivirga luteola TaxID=1774748 RepID=A0A8J2XLM3_9MICO|nr:DNA polymerase III subunit gamma and tau [Sediminivirga luteola]GGA23986.1 DNA polymerase III subunit gamma and tau [Sediminivirga luteola]